MFDPAEDHTPEAAWLAIEHELNELAGTLNAAHGRIAQLTAYAVEHSLTSGPGIHSDAHWLSWQLGMAPSRAAGIVKLAKRSEELPTALAALVAGEISVDAASTIARLTPAGYDQAATAFAKDATIGQLRRTLRDYAYEDPDATKPKPPERGLSSGTDDDGWFMRARLSADEGAVVDQAIQTMRDDLFRQEASATLPGEDTPVVTSADGLLAIAECALRSGEARHPGSSRYLVNLHLATSADGTSPSMTTHLGDPLPAWQRRLHSCNPTIRAVFHRRGTPLDVGRRTRSISSRLRLAIEHRDGGCAVPGCGRTSGLEIHHLTHWEHGGTTTTSNLVCLCRRHHRLHHQGLLHISGNADEALTFTDKFHRDLAARPTCAHPAAHPGTYQRSRHEPLSARDVQFRRDDGGGPPVVGLPGG